MSGKILIGGLCVALIVAMLGIMTCMGTAILYLFHVIARDQNYLRLTDIGMGLILASIFISTGSGLLTLVHYLWTERGEW